MKTLALIFILASCSAPIVTPPPAPKTPAQVVFETKAAEGAALAIFIRYKALPSCSVPMPPTLCANAGVVTKVQQADVIAAKAIDTAETAVRTPGFGTSILASLAAAAQAAVSVLTSSTAGLRLQ